MYGLEIPRERRSKSATSARFSVIIITEAKNKSYIAIWALLSEDLSLLFTSIHHSENKDSGQMGCYDSFIWNLLSYIKATFLAIPRTVITQVLFPNWLLLFLKIMCSKSV